MGSKSQERFAVQVLNTALGAEMYSRLFQEIREKRGLAYSVGSYYSSYQSGGLLIAYGGINAKNWSDVYNIVLEEVADICRNGLSSVEIEMAKNTLIGQAVLRRETPTAIMGIQAENEILFGEERTVDDCINDFSSVTGTQIIDYARANCTPEQSSFALICPKSKKTRGILSWILKR